MVATGAAATVASGGQPAAPPSAATTTTDADLPAGWKSAVDMATGVTYYYNVRLNTQQWERPGGAGAAMATGAAASAGDDQGPFVSSTAFSGRKAGYVFKKGEKGLGYYRYAHRRRRR